MKTLTQVLFALLLVTGFNNAFAQQQTQDRHLSGFKGIDVGGPFDVTITQGSTESVKVEAQQEDLQRITTEVVNGVLKIYNKREYNNFNWFGKHRKVMVYVTARELNMIGVSGSGDVSFRNGITASSLRLQVSGSGDMVGKVDTKELETGISGSGDISISGRAVNSSVGVSGSGDFRGSQLVTNSTSVRVSGSGDASVNANDSINASVSGSGDVHYTGSASHVSTSKSGSGEIHRM